MDRAQENSATDTLDASTDMPQVHEKPNNDASVQKTLDELIDENREWVEAVGFGD